MSTTEYYMLAFFMIVLAIAMAVLLKPLYAIPTAGFGIVLLVMALTRGKSSGERG